MFSYPLCKLNAAVQRLSLRESARTVVGLRHRTNTWQSVQLRSLTETRVSRLLHHSAGSTFGMCNRPDDADGYFLVF